MSAGHRCPGQDIRFWGPDDIFNVSCPRCGAAVEFFKDDARRPCPACGAAVFNPRIEQGCALWCPKAEECLGPERYGRFLERARLAEERRRDFDRLLETVDPGDTELRDLFKRLYVSNTDPASLVDTASLARLKDENPALFARAVACFSAFNRRGEKQG